MSEAFDERELMGRVDGDLEFLEETVEMLDEDGPPLLEQIRGAVAGRDAEAIARLAHALKGILSNFCAGPAQAAAVDLERMGRENRLDDTAPAVERLGTEMDTVRAALHEFLRARSS